ncbi:MAG: hypothetical protein E7166_03605 [Firmicutes bacterium]|nr:hypothetical protein [Bacillota bacterium]
MNKGYVISKNTKNKEIEIIEYEQHTGFDISPRNKVKKGNSIDVSKVIFMSPTLIEKLLKKKIDREYKRILILLTEVAADDSDDTSKLSIALNEVELFKSIIRKKYSKFMEDKKTAQLLKRLELMSKELKRRIFEIEEEKQYNNSRGGKSR